MDTGSLIELQQLPVIQQQLQKVKAEWSEIASRCQAMVCTEETVKDIKAYRTEMNKEFQVLEDARKGIREQIMAPYDAFVEIYRDCVLDSFREADNALKEKITSVEDEIKQRCEDRLREYFSETAAAFNVDWLKYEQAGIRVGMTEARQKTPRKSMSQIMEFVSRVVADVDTISGMEYADELLAEYKQTLSLATAIATVSDRHQRVEEAKAENEKRRQAPEEEREAVTILKEEIQEPEFTLTLEVTGTRERIVALREFMKANQIAYRQVRRN